jgi:hypothetical protein
MFGTITSLQLTGQSTEATAGGPPQALLGGTSQTGGVAVDLNGQAGTISAEISAPLSSDFVSQWSSTSGFSSGNFAIYDPANPAAPQQVWDLNFTGQLSTSGAVVQFHYDDSLLSEYYQSHESELGIWHFNSQSQAWEFLRDSIDTQNNIVTITTLSFSPNVFGAQPNQVSVATPEPASIIAWMSLGSLAIAVRKFRRRR